MIALRLAAARQLSPADVGLRVQSPDGKQGVFSLWRVESRDPQGRDRIKIVSLAASCDGLRLPVWEKKAETLFSAEPHQGTYHHDAGNLLRNTRELLQREMEQRGLAGAEKHYQADLIGWIEAY
jgi:hypothetical protein